MGRMMDALSHTNGRRTAVLAPPPSPAPAGVAELDEDDGVPFVEVGAPLPGAGRVAPPPAPEPRPSGLFSIHFQPLPAAAPPQRAADGRFAAELIAYHQPDHPVAAQYRTLAAEVAAQVPAAGGRLVAFTGGAAGAGATTVALNLAVTLASAGARVLAVDAHPSRPDVADRLGLPDGPGLAEVLARTSPLAWALQMTDLPGLHALTAGRGERATRAGLAALLEGLRGRYDWVIVDAPEWTDRDGLSSLAPAADGVYLVLRRCDLDAAELGDLPAASRHCHGKLRGYVLTQ